MAKRAQRIRRSYGIICCSLVKNQPARFLLVRKRFTYAFIDFAYLHIPNPRTPTNLPKLQRILQAMTQEERLVILSLDFSVIWWHARLTPCEGALFEYKKKIFESWFLRDRGDKLVSLLMGCKGTKDDQLWGFPKGRRADNEPPLACALREFAEETNWTSSDLQLFPGIFRSLTYADAGREYVDKAFVALTHHAWAPSIDMANRNQISEIAEVRWLSIQELELLAPGSRVLEILRPIQERVRKELRPRVGRRRVIEFAP